MRNVYPGKCPKCGVLFNGKQAHLQLLTISTTALLTIKDGSILTREIVSPMPIQYRCGKCGHEVKPETVDE